MCYPTLVRYTRAARQPGAQPQFPPVGHHADQALWGKKQGISEARSRQRWL